MLVTDILGLILGRERENAKEDHKLSFSINRFLYSEKIVAEISKKLVL